MKTIAGVALAAVMACGLGGVQRAEAAPLDIKVVADAFRGNTDYGFLTFEYVSTNIDPLIEFQNLQGTFTVSSSYLNYSESVFSGQASFGQTYDGQRVFQIFGDNQSRDRNFYFSFVFNHSLPAGLIDLSGIGLSLPDEYGLIDNEAVGNYLYLRDASISITGSMVNLYPIPLPASAPLFGAALLALGGIGYASRRGRPKAA